GDRPTNLRSVLYAPGREASAHLRPTPRKQRVGHALRWKIRTGRRRNSSSRKRPSGGETAGRFCRFAEGLRWTSIGSPVRAPTLHVVPYFVQWIPRGLHGRFRFARLPGKGDGGPIQ
ncbi:unnamed protein product, partial [Ectocarpus fasciculatus]